MKAKRFLNADVLFGVAVLAVSVWFFLMGQGLASISLAGSIDAGFFPRMLAIVVGLLSALLIVQGVRSPRPYFGKAEDGSNNLAMFLETVLLFGLYVLLWKLVHFIPLTLAFLLGMSFVLKLSLKFAIIYSVIVSCGLFYLFAGVFRIILN